MLSKTPCLRLSRSIHRNIATLPQDPLRRFGFRAKLEKRLDFCCMGGPKSQQNGQSAPVSTTKTGKNRLAWES